jgi:membrane-bound lytic murein transglycosylase D
MFVAAALSFAPHAAEAAPRKFKRNPEFITPAGLRGRVDFWKDVFAKYERNQVSVHHRAFPQIVFEVVDLRTEAAEMEPAAFERYRKNLLEGRVKRITEAMKPLSEGKEPSNELEQLVADKMSYIKDIPNRYTWTLKEDLVRTQSGIREKWLAAIERSGRYLGIMERIFVDEYSLPIEITRLPFVESSFDYTAYSSVGAAGIWQFMPRTGKQFRLTVNSIVDERRDPIKATDAAARYLSSAYRSLGSWPLAIISYNHGVGGVMRKVREAGTSDIATLLENPTTKGFGFASNNFFPSFLAAVECYDERKTLFPEMTVAAPLKLTEYRLPRAMSVAHVTRQLGMSEENLKQANYALLEKVWSGRALIPSGYVLRVPEEYGVRLASLRAPEVGVSPVAAASSSVYGGASYRVRKGDTLGKIAKHYGVSTAKLLELNGLKSEVLKVGQVLVVKAPQAAKGREASGSKEPAKKAPPPASEKKSKGPATNSYRVRPGDSLSSIGKRFGTTPEALKKLNGMKGSNLKAGQTLAIPQ